MKQYVCVDIETTGLSKHYHKITEIAAARVVGNKIVDTFQSLVNPQTPIPKFITKLTGIDDEMVKDAPAIEQVIPSFLAFMGEDVMVAHNASFDFGFLSVNAELADYSMENKRLCTRKLANRLVEDHIRKKLGSLCEHFNIVNTNAHRAMADVHATVELYEKLRELMANRYNIKEQEEIFSFEKMCKAKILGGDLKFSK